MITKKMALLSAGIFFILCQLINAQSTDPLESISEAELRDHIFFLASDYLNGRVGISPQYEIAAQYVATQFAAAGLQPVLENEEGSKSWFQGVPFAKTTYSDEIKWKIIKPGEENTLIHQEDFKILYGSKLNHDKIALVYAGYGIEEPEHEWNDFEDIDVEGKILVVISGAPVKNGKAVLPEEVHRRYTGPRGLQSKIGALFSKGAEGLILVDIDASSGMPFSIIPSEFAKEKYVYQGGGDRQQRSMPSVYLARPEILNTLMGKPSNDPADIVKNYSPGLIEDTYLDSQIEILSEALVYASNVTGMVPGTDPVLKNEYIVVGAHLDHVKPVNGQVCNGADDNASGSAGVIEIAEALAMNPCKRSVIFITYTAEEMGLIGSR
ncbi:MAG: M28 family peptidase, partial [Bacteroidales bacterium]|nr:M28 family peptidase [Bacteroidales bacterium]